MKATAIEPFRFKHFVIEQDRCAMKVGTDGVLLGAWADVEGVQRALDIGAGTGVIALMLGQRQPEAIVDAVEIDEQAAGQARENAAASIFRERVRVHCQAIQRFCPPENGPYDLIVSNPPFFTGGVLSDNQDRREVRHTIKLPHGDLLHAVQRLLAPTGRFCLVLPLLEGLRFRQLAENYHLYTTKLAEVYPRPNKPISRLLLQLEKNKQPLQRESFCIYPETGEQWTEAYRSLTKEFYLKA